MRSFQFLPALALLVLAGCDNRPVQKQEQAEAPASKPSPSPNPAPNIAATLSAEKPQESAGPAIATAAKKKQQPMLIARIEKSPLGDIIRTTYVVINHVTAPGITESMRDPMLTGVFRDGTLVVNEILICDGGAGTRESVDASCKAVPQDESPSFERLLTSAFKAHQEKAWKPLGDTIGITNTS